MIQVAYVPRHFVPQEFLPRQIYEQLERDGTLWKAWLLIDERLLRFYDAARERFGVLTINNWHAGGTRNESGLRLPGMATFKPTSQHSFGRAGDGISPSLSGEDMRRYILDHPDEFPTLHAIEIGTSWLHADVRNCVPIAQVNPT